MRFLMILFSLLVTGCTGTLGQAPTEEPQTVTNRNIVGSDETATQCGVGSTNPNEAALKVVAEAQAQQTAAMMQVLTSLIPGAVGAASPLGVRAAPGVRSLNAPLDAPGATLGSTKVPVQDCAQAKTCVFFEREVPSETVEGKTEKQTCLVLENYPPPALGYPPAQPTPAPAATPPPVQPFEGFLGNREGELTPKEALAECMESGVSEEKCKAKLGIPDK